MWRTEDVLPIFDDLRTERGSARPLRLAGFDVQPIGGRKKDRPAFFAALVEPIDRKYAKAVEALDQEFIAMYDKGGAARRTYFREQGATVVEGFTRYEIAAPPANTLESRVESGADLVFVDLHAAASTPAGAWLRGPVRARFNGQTPHTFIPVQQYDALISIASVTPPKFLY